MSGSRGTPSCKTCNKVNHIIAALPLPASPVPEHYLFNVLCLKLLRVDTENSENGEVQ